MANLVEESCYSKENMKMAMLKHEQTFRHQVYELHRLYRIQKVLMKNIIRENRGKTERWDLKNEDEGGEEINFIEESEIELTLGPSNYSNQIGSGERRRRRRRNKLLGEIKGCSDSGMSFSSSSSTTGSAQKTLHFYRNGDLEDDMRLSHHHPNANPWLYQVFQSGLFQAISYLVLTKT